jgi:ATP-dependent DNA helicase RecG
MESGRTDIERLLAQGESKHLAFVRGSVKPDDLAETLAALANAQGGTVVIGVGRTRKAEGVRDPSTAIAVVLDAGVACTPPLITPLPKVVSYGDTALLVVQVPPGLPNVYCVRGKYLRREGAADEPIPPDALRRLLLERGTTSWERLSPDGARLADLDERKVDGYVQRSGSAAEHDAATFLFRRGCLARRDDDQPAGGSAALYQPTSAGLLLFGRDVERFFPQCEITLVRYRGREMSDEFLREDIRDTLVEAARRAEIWLSEAMRRGSRMVGLERQDWTQFPLGAVREVLVNAIAHRDYSVRGEGIRIGVYSDRLECYSPGRLPGHVTLQNIVEERFSRNETLVQVLADYGLIERLGYGIDRMLRQMADAGLPPPEFRETAAGFLVTLRGQVGEDSHDVEGVDVGEWRKLGLNERQIAALLHLIEQRRITNRDMQELAPDVSAETLRRDLADLVERGMLLRVGDKRGAYYILK